MAKSMEEINAEKRTKSRPDLIPARVLELFYERTSELDECDVEEYGSFDPTMPLIAFARSGDIDDLIQAMFETAALRVSRGEYGHGLAMGRVLAYGLAKHGVCTWRVAGTEQADPQTHYASALRHLLEFFGDNDAREEGSGFPVLDHALTQMAILADLVLDPPKLLNENDGRWAIVSARKPVELVTPVPTFDLPAPFMWQVDSTDGSWMATDGRATCVYYPPKDWPQRSRAIERDVGVPDEVCTLVIARNQHEGR